MAHLSRIEIFPIKSLDGMTVETATVLASGALQYDREYAIVDAAGRVVNGKRTAAIHGIRAKFDLAQQQVTLWVNDRHPPITGHLEADRREIEHWLSKYFGFAVCLIRNQEMGFPDDTISPGPTVISTATLEATAPWFPGLTLDNLRCRFRTNLEIAAVEAFWEDTLYGAMHQARAFAIGDLHLLGINPCQRCIVPGRDPQTGAAYPNFQKIFLKQRQATLPATVERSRFNHFYRLALNTRPAPQHRPTQIRLGDRVDLSLDSIASSPQSL
jgi:uncharacterized protein YcbX